MPYYYNLALKQKVKDAVPDSEELEGDYNTLEEIDTELRKFWVMPSYYVNKGKDIQELGLNGHGAIGKVSIVFSNW